MRILGEGQYEIADMHLTQLNELDAVLQSGAESGDEQAFAAGLRALLDAVRALGTPLPADSLTPSDLILPDEDTSLHEVQALLADEGLSELTGGMGKYDWAINGKQFGMNNPTANPVLVEQGQRVRLDFVNTTTMWHPMHLHGHTYQLGTNGPRKDTTIVLPKKTVSIHFDADNPGQWMLHCHNAYHGEPGMMALVAYRA